MSGSPPVAVVGAGWSGLAAAVRLVERGHPVTVLEAAQAPGGRARGIEVDGATVDNGQHLLLGAYRATLGLLATLGVAEASVLERRPFAITLEGPGQRFRLRRGPGRGLVGVAAGLATCRGLGPGDRLRALMRAPALRRPPTEALDAERWLARIGQPVELRARLWRPLCLAALNLPTERACARAFARVLREAFSAPGSSDLLIPRTDLGGVLPRPAMDWLRGRGAEVRFGQRVRALEGDAGGWRLHTRGGHWSAAHVVLAGDARACARLLPQDDAGTRALHADLAALGAEPITTAYVRYPTAVRLPEPMIGRLDGPAQWLFDRAVPGQPGTIAAVISGRSRYDTAPREALAAAVERQLASAYPHWPRPLGTHVIREKRATFACTPGSEHRRPQHRGPRPGLWLAGDHAATELPATLEGAIRAGLACAEAVHAER